MRKFVETMTGQSRSNMVLDIRYLALPGTGEGVRFLSGKGSPMSNVFAAMNSRNFTIPVAGKRIFLAFAIACLAACGGGDEPANDDAGTSSGTGTELSSDEAATAAPTPSAPEPAAPEKLEPSVDVAATDASLEGLPQVKIATSYGDITVALFPAQSPVSVENFLTYARDRFYTRTIFHRVIPGFMIQGGGFSVYLEQRKTRDPIAYEGDNGLDNMRGTLAMARTRDPNSATAQWFINLEDNVFLNHGANGEGVPGYTVFGKVISGLNIVDAIALVDRDSAYSGDGRPLENVPVTPVLIEGVEIIKE